MDELNKRVIELMARLDMSKPVFARELGVSVPLIIHIVTGRNKPGIDLIQKILGRFEEVSPDWLLMGKGQIYREKPEAIDLSAEVEAVSRAIALLAEPKATNKTMAGYYKLLMDELLH